MGNLPLTSKQDFTPNTNVKQQKKFHLKLQQS